MNLIKVGNRYINLDNVNSIILDKPYPGTIRVFFNDDTNKDFEGQEAEALRYFLDGNSNDVMEIFKDQEYDRVPA